MLRSLFIWLLFVLPAFAQGQHERCLVQPVHTQDVNRKYAAFRKMIRQYQMHQPMGMRSVVTMPVVIHVVARDPVQPVSMAQALQQIDVLNADFSGFGENTNKLPDEFRNLVADVMIRFCLATTDPEGQPTNGITFTQTTIADIALQTGQGGRKSIHWDQLGGKTGWDPARYINIWIGEYGSLLGSASFPGMAAYPEEIGIVVDPKYFGAIGDAGQSGFYSHGHTLTHEMGHFLGLKHIWGDGLDFNCEDTDDIADTPNAEGPHYDCPGGILMSCGTSNMYQNFMDFTDDRCLAAFTHGQSGVMQAVRSMYYADVVMMEPCAPEAISIEEWFDALTWSFDASSQTYVVYAPEIWSGQKKVEVYGMDGKQLFTGVWTDEFTFLIDLEPAAAGVYVVRIKEGSKYFVRKLMVY